MAGRAGRWQGAARWARWLLTVLGATLLARLGTGLLLPAADSVFLWGGALILGLGLTFTLAPMPNEQMWPEERATEDGGRGLRGKD